MSHAVDADLACLSAVLKSLGEHGERLAARHPRSRELRERPAGDESLERLWWRELESLEEHAQLARKSEPAQRSAASYYLRRRDLARWERWRAASAQLDRTWRALLEWPAVRAREACIQLGLRAVAVCAARVPRHELPLWLRPFGAQRAHEVLQLVIHAPPASAPQLAEQVRAAVAELVLERRGDRLLSALGRRVLAARMKTSLDLAALDAAGIAGSDLLRLLRAEPPLALASADQARAVDEWLEQLVR